MAAEGPPARSAPAAPAATWSVSPAAQAARFQAFTFWLGLAAAAYGLGELAAWVALGEPVLAVTGALTLALAPLCLVARRASARGRLETAASGLALGFLAMLVVLTAALPVMAPLLAVASLLGVAIALPYLRGRALARVAIASALAAGAIVAIGATLPPWSAPPPWLSGGILTTGLAVTVALVTLLLWQFSQRLNETLAEVEAAHAGLQRAHARLQELDRMKAQFLNNAAHELRTPMTPIMLQVHLLRDRLPGAEDPEYRRAVGVLDRNVVRLNRLVDDLLDVARLEGREAPLSLEPVDLRRLAAEAVESYADAAVRSELRLELTAEPGVVVRADPKRVLQVLFNLLGNAVRLTPSGGFVAVEVAQRGGEGEVRVRDSGPGVPAEDRERLFQPFVQLGNDGAARGGAGLGLFVSRRIVERHGGRIGCASEGPGRGATFWFTLPLAPGARPSAP